MKNKKSENYLDKIPVRNEELSWTTDEKGLVTLSIENKGIFNKIAQLVFKKPRISYVHLDENGSFVWKSTDGEKTVADIGVMVEAHFGDAAKPVYERLVKYFTILSGYGFVKFR